LDVNDREKLLILLGSAQATINSQSDEVPIIPRTEKNYGMIYERWLAGGRQISPEFSGQTKRWWVSAVRFKTLERMRGASADLELALRAVDDAGAVSAGALVRECLDVLERNPAGRPGKRARIRDEEPPKRGVGRPRTSKRNRPSVAKNPQISQAGQFTEGARS
jgi:hypothetical protein